MTLNVIVNKTKECTQRNATDKHIESLYFPKKRITRNWLIIIYIGELNKIKEIEG
jgi:hypothetical protein